MRYTAAFLLCLTPAVAFAQEDDRSFLTGLLEDNLSGAGREVRIEGFQGALSSRARMTSLTIADDEGVWLRLTDVLLDWNRSALFGGRVSVNALTAAEITLERLPNAGEDLPSPEAAPFSLPDLPVSVQIGQITAEKITLGPTVLGEEITARLDGGANLGDGEGNARLELKRTDGTAGALVLEGGFVNSSRELRLDLSLQEPQGGIAARMIGLPGEPALDLSIKGQGPIENFTANVALRSDGQERVAGSVRLSSEKEGAKGFDLDLKGDVTPLFLPDYHDFFGPDVALKAEGSQSATGALRLNELRIDAAALRLSGSADIAPDGMPNAFDLNLDLSAADGEPVRLPLSGDPVEVRAAKLRLGFAGDQGSDAWTLAGSLTGLSTPALTADVFSLEGRGRIGRAADRSPMADGALRFDSAGLKMTDPGLDQALGDRLIGQTRFDWQSGQPLRISDLKLEGGDYSAEGSFDVSTASGEPEITGRIGAVLQDLGRISVLAGRATAGKGTLSWSGSVKPLSGAFDGQLSLDGTDLSIGMAEVDGLLRGQSLVSLDAARGGEGTQIRALDLRGQSLRVQGQGWIRSTGPDLTARLDFTDLSVMGASYGGSLSADATLKGKALDSDLNLTLKGSGSDLKTGIAEADGFLRGETALDIDAHLLDGIVTLRQAALTGQTWDAGISGFAGTESRNLRARFALEDLSRAGGPYRGRLSGNLTYALTNGTETAAIDAEAGDIAIGQAEADRLLRGVTRLSAVGSRTAGVLRLEKLDLQNPQLSASGNARQEGDRRLLALQARLNDLGLLVQGVPGALTLQGDVTEQDGTLNLDIRARGPGGIDLSVAGTSGLNFANSALRITGSADAALANAFTGGVALRGPLRLDLSLNGAPALSSLSGRVSLSDGRLTIASPAMGFSGLNGGVTLAGGRAEVALSAASDAGGRVTVNGPITLTAPFQGSLVVTPERLGLRDPQLYETKASGRVEINGPLAGGAMIQGRIRLEETELRIPSTGLGGSAAIPELRHVYEPAGVRATRARAGLLGGAGGTAGGSSGGDGPVYGLNLFILAENQVFIRGRGLDAELGGSFRISGTTANVVPSGGLELIRGRLDLLGKRFNFAEGTLQMEGSMVPRIRLVANTDTVDGTASVIIDGPADQPEITFTSSPELPQEEVVARLLFGRGLTSLTPLQAAQLASAVATLSGKGGAGIVDSLRRNFGLDDFDVSASENGAAAVRAGKYLSENIYVDLKLDSDGQSEVSINLDLSKSVTVRGRATADGNTGLGIHYERDY